MMLVGPPAGLGFRATLRNRPPTNTRTRVLLGADATANDERILQEAFRVLIADP